MAGSGRAPRTLVTISVLGVLFLAFLGSAAGARTRAGSTWQLVDYHQSACFDSSTSGKYFGIYIKGKWRQPLDVGISSLPDGGSFTTLYAPIPPGSSRGEYSLAYVRVALPSDAAVGTYVADLWAGTSRTTKSVPVSLLVKTKCGY